MTRAATQRVLTKRARENGVTEKFGIGSMGIGSLSGVLDTMDMVKRAWSSFNLPSNLAPTLDVDELDRRITDLKAVEQWLTMNLGMLQGTIRGLEVQRGTLAALQAFGQAMSSPADAGSFAAQAMAAMQRAVADAAQGADAGARAAAEPASTASSASGFAGWPTGAAAKAPEAPTAPAAPEAWRTAGANARAERAGADEGTAQAGTIGESLAEGMSRAAAAANPTAWWNLLQSQFEQVAQAALAGSAPAQTNAPASAGSTAAGADKKGRKAPGKATPGGERAARKAPGKATAPRAGDRGSAPVGDRGSAPAGGGGSAPAGDVRKAARGGTRAR